METAFPHGANTATIHEGERDHTPCISIIVPCYNTAAYLPSCLDSLACQTLEDIEIICVNDGSPGDDLRIMQDYASKNPALFRVVDKENGGLWSARWSGTDVARGEYVAYVDSDDFVESTFAEDLYTAAKKHDADIVVCGFRRIEAETGRELSCEMSEAQPAFSPQETPGLLVPINSAAWNKAFRRTLLMRMHRLDTPPSILEDVMLTQLAYLASSAKLAFTGTAPYRYFIREGSMINTVTIEQVESVKQALLEVRSHFNADCASEALLAELDATAFLHLGISMSYRLSTSEGINLPHEIRRTTAYLNKHFPTWSQSPYINLSSARRSPGAFKLFAASLAYRAHLIRPLLAAYRFVLEHSDREIKW